MRIVALEEHYTVPRIVAGSSPDAIARRGIGLGLYLVRLVVEGHGGAVAVEDRPGGGSRFRFWLQLT